MIENLLFDTGVEKQQDYNRAGKATSSTTEGTGLDLDTLSKQNRSSTQDQEQWRSRGSGCAIATQQLSAVLTQVFAKVLCMLYQVFSALS